MFEDSPLQTLSLPTKCRTSSKTKTAAAKMNYSNSDKRTELNPAISPAVTFRPLLHARLHYITPGLAQLQANQAGLKTKNSGWCL